MSEEDIPEFEVKSYSASRHNLYLRCPYLFFRKYIDEEKAVFPDSHLATMGKKSHNFIQIYYENVDAQHLFDLPDFDTYDYIISEFRKIVPSDDANVEMTAIIRGFADIECDRIALLRQHTTTETFVKYYLPVLVEYKAEMPIELEVKESIEVEYRKTPIRKVTSKVRSTLRMILDAVFLDYQDDRHMVLDWKTGYAKPKLAGNVNRQLYIYVHFIEILKVKDKFGNVIMPKGLCVVFPRYGAVLYKDRTIRSESPIINNVGKCIRKIAEEEFPRNPSMFNCGWNKDEDRVCPLYEEECKEFLIREGYIYEPDIKAEVDGLDDEDGEEDEEEYEEEDNAVLFDFSEGNWDALEKDSME